MPIVSLDKDSWFSSLQMLFAQCPKCGDTIGWRLHTDLTGQFHATCCDLIFEGTIIPEKPPVFRIQAGAIKKSKNVRFFKKKA